MARAIKSSTSPFSGLEFVQRHGFSLPRNTPGVTDSDNLCQTDNPDDDDDNPPQKIVEATIQRGNFPYSRHPTDNSAAAAASSPRKWRRTANSRGMFPCSRRPAANFGHRAVNLHFVLTQDLALSTQDFWLPQTPPPQINEGAAPHTAAKAFAEIKSHFDFGLLTIDC